MTTHTTLEPATREHIAAVRLRADESPGAAPAAEFVDVVCADHELLRAEFDAIIAANFPDAADGSLPHVPTGPVGTGTDRAGRPPGAAPVSASPRRGEARPAGPPNPQVRQRGPPHSTTGEGWPGRSGPDIDRR